MSRFGYKKGSSSVNPHKPPTNFKDRKYERGYLGNYHR